MSRSWSRLARALWPEPAESWGLVLGAQRIVACRANRTEKQWRVEAVAAEASPVPLYSGAPPADLAARLAPVIEKVAAGAARRHVPLGVAVPDPAVNLLTLELESLPATVAEREALARWHLDKLAATGPERTVRVQDLGAGDGKPLLLSCAMAGAWLDGLAEACRLAGITPTIWQPAILHRFNLHHAAMQRAGQDGALLVLEPDAWTLLLYDSHGRIRFVRSRWRNTGPESDLAGIAVEVERMVRAYVHGGRDRRLEVVHLLGDDTAVREVAAHINARGAGAGVPMPALSGIESADGVNLASEGAVLAATIARVMPT